MFINDILNNDKFDFCGSWQIDRYHSDSGDVDCAIFSSLRGDEIPYDVMMQEVTYVSMFYDASNHVCVLKIEYTV